MTTLLDQLAPRSPEQPGQVAQPKTKRGRWHRERRPTKAERAAQDEALTAELRQRLATWDRERAAQQGELLAKSSELPPGVKVVSGQEGQSR